MVEMKYVVYRDNIQCNVLDACYRFLFTGANFRDTYLDDSILLQGIFRGRLSWILLFREFFADVCTGFCFRIIFACNAVGSCKITVFCVHKLSQRFVCFYVSVWKFVLLRNVMFIQCKRRLIFDTFLMLFQQVITSLLFNFVI